MAKIRRMYVFQVSPLRHDPNEVIILSVFQRSRHSNCLDSDFTAVRSAIVNELRASVRAEFLGIPAIIIREMNKLNPRAFENNNGSNGGCCSCEARPVFSTYLYRASGSI